MGKYRKSSRAHGGERPRKQETADLLSSHALSAPRPFDRGTGAGACDLEGGSVWKGRKIDVPSHGARERTRIALEEYAGGRRAQRQRVRNRGARQQPAHDVG